MDIEVDGDTGAQYIRLTSGTLARTIHVTDLIMVDLDQDNQPIGIEVAVDINRVSTDDLALLRQAFPQVSAAIRMAGTQSPGDLTHLAASIIDKVAEPSLYTLRQIPRPDDISGVVVLGIVAGVAVSGLRLREAPTGTFAAAAT